MAKPVVVSIPTLSGRAEFLDDSVRIEVELPRVITAIADKHRIRAAATLRLEKE